MALHLASLWNRGFRNLESFTEARDVFPATCIQTNLLIGWSEYLSELWLLEIFITWQCNFHWPASLSIWASSEGGLSMRSFLGVRLQTRTLLSSNPPDRRLESSDILTVFKLQERQED